MSITPIIHQTATIKSAFDASPVESLTERRTRWSKLLQKQHFEPVIEEVLEEELLKYQTSSVIDTSDRVALLRECALILASAPSVFTAAVEGNLATRLLEDANLQEEYKDVQQRAYEQPSIYIHLLVDEKGIAPTPNQYMVIRDLILDYLTDGKTSEHAWAIDNITPPAVTKQASTQGQRKYLYTTQRSPKRIAALETLCDGIHSRYLDTPQSLHNTPFRFPPGECGYSKNSHARLAQHRAHRSSNPIMNLVSDICTHLSRTNCFTQHFTMHQYIIYLIFRPTQASIAEIFCSGLLQVWVENGGGFNAYPAGRSVATAKKVSSEEWRDHERWTRENSPVDENMKVQKERAEEWSRVIEWDGGGGEVEIDEAASAEIA